MKALALKYPSETLFIISLGPVAKIFAHQMWLANPKNMYIDVGSAVDGYVKGRNSRPYADPNSPYSKKICSPYRKCADNTRKACHCTYSDPA